MKCKEIKKLDLCVYEEKLDNGLSIYVVPMEYKNNIYTTFTTKFGANILEFVPIDESKYIKMPPGIAHFLEHKVFEQEDGVDPFSYFTKNGADANAFTNIRQTTYLFEGPDNFYDNLNYLLDYVQSPYFTDKNVEKEKGIIEQELKMYDDNPYVKIEEEKNKNIYTTRPYRIPVGGTIEDVYSITKEELYKCYNTFYNPSNMFIVVVGNVDPELTIECIKKNQSKKCFRKSEKIKVKLSKEKDNVSVSYDVIEKDIALPKVLISYKINRKYFSRIKKHLQGDVLYIFAASNFNINSHFFEKLQKENILNFAPSINVSESKDHLVLNFSFETYYGDIVIKKVNELIKKKTLSSREFERGIKGILCGLIYMSDNIFRINRYITSSIVSNELSYTIYDDYKSLKYEECADVIKGIDLKNRSILIVNTKEQ